MTRTAVVILEEALRLSPEERAELANELLNSLVDEDTVPDGRWTDGFERRPAADDRGLPAPAVVARGG